MDASATPARNGDPSGLLERHLAAVEALLGKILRHGGFDLTVGIRRAEGADRDPEAPEVIVEFTGPDSALLVASGGSVLNALEYVVLRAVRLDENVHGKIAFDCEDFRKLRAEELRMMAEVAAARVAETGQPFELNPMAPRERRLVHLALKNNPAVRTASDGAGHERRVVIHPAASPPRR